MMFRGDGKRLVLFLACLVIFSAALVAGDLRVGTASVKITPPPGHPMAGGYSIRLSKGTHDDLLAKALVLEKDGVKAALVACDLVALSDGVVGQARKLIKSQTAVPPENVMISATHTHSGPVISGRHALDPYIGGDMKIARDYVDQLSRSIAQSVKDAESKLTTVRVAAGVGREESVSFNRRFLMKDGTIGWNPGRLNPEIVRPAGPIDPDLAVVLFTASDERPVATYLNFPLHVAVAGGTQYSSDYPGVIARLLAAVKGDEMLTLFTEGAAGNVNHINVKDARQPGGYRESVRIGTILAAEVLKTYRKLKPLGSVDLRVQREIVDLEPAEVRPGDVEKARQVAEKMKGPDPPPFIERVKAFKILNVDQRNYKVRAEVQVITLGEQVAWVALPGEIFVELGQAIKMASPYPCTVVVALANGWLSYVPDRKAFAEGNYEPLSSLGAPGSGEKMVQTAVRLLVRSRYGSEKLPTNARLAQEAGPRPK